MYTKQELNISGKRAIAFMGKLLAMASDRDTSEQTTTEWDSVLVYEVDPKWAAQQEKKNGKRIDPYTIGFAKCTKWIGDRDRYKVFYARTVQQVFGVVRSQMPKFLREIEEKLRLNEAPTGTLEYEPSRSPVES